MELQKTNGQNTSPALLKISQSALSQAVIRGDFKKASSLLPTKIELAIEEPKIFELAKIHSEETLKRMIEFELIQLAGLMSVGGNLNQSQIVFIAAQLIEMYPNESIADFKICFTRGAMGHYGNIQRLDGLTIGEWFKSYLDEKYEVLENMVAKSKESDFKTPLIDGSGYEQFKAWAEAMRIDIQQDKSKRIAPLTDQDVIDEGQEKPKVYNHPSAPASYITEIELKIQYGREHTDLLTGRTLDGHPTFNEWREQLNQNQK